MACVLNKALLVLWSISLAGASVPYKTSYFEQNLDHFNFVQDKTFKQRYLFTGKITWFHCLTLWHPVKVMTGNLIFFSN